MKKSPHHIARDQVGEVSISTVYIGEFYPKKLGQYETMIFGGRYGGRQWRYDTIEEAKEGHAVALSLVKASVAKIQLEQKEAVRSISFKDE